MLFSQVIGQTAVKQKLISSCREGRVSHALLFFGPKGAGVWPLANAFAQFLTCENPGIDDSCGVCLGCKKNAKMVHPDVHYVYPVMTSKKFKQPKSTDYVIQWRQTALDNPYLEYNDWVDVIAESETKQATIMVEEASDIIHKINLKAFEAPYKVVVMWLPERMGPPVANKLLKSIEEPPDNTVFILASEQRDALLQTILSRTQMIKVGRLSDDEIVEVLIQKHQLTKEKASEIARYSDGNYRIALELATQEQGEGSHEQDFINWMRLCFNTNKTMSGLLNWIEGIASSSRDQQKHFLFSTIQVVRECLMMNVSGGKMVKLDPQQQETLALFKPFINKKNVDFFISELNKAHFHVERNANPKILFLDLSLKISKILQIK